MWLLAVRFLPAARFTDDSPARRTSSSESCALRPAELAVTFTRTKRVFVAGNGIVTVFDAPGLKEYVAEVFSVVKLVPSALPWRERVCCLPFHPAGSLSVTPSTRVEAPRSVCTHWGRESPAPSQYVDRSPSVTFPAPYARSALLAVAVRPVATPGPSAATAVSDGHPIIRRLVATAADTARRLQRWALIDPRSSAPARERRGCGSVHAALRQRFLRA